jgi:hypothetical protein
MTTNDVSLEELQRQVCRDHDQAFVPSAPDSRLGFALHTGRRSPINGLRHPPAGETNGWYIWCGEHFLGAPDFFSPLHTMHLQERCPEALRILGLPPGYRFLIAQDHEDVWFDASLLDVQ